MKKILVFALACMMIISSVTAVFANEDGKIPAVFFYVATDGDDANNGSQANPFRTLEAALDAAKGEAGTVVINIRGGIYQITDTINLTAEHNNTVIRSYNGEEVLFTGSQTIPASAFSSKCTDQAFLDALIDKSAKDKILSANLKDLGITEYGTIAHQGFLSGDDIVGYAPTFSIGEKPLTLAEYPNEGYIYTEKIISESSEIYNTGYKEFKFTASDKRYLKWADGDIWANGYYSYDWANAVAPVKISEDGTINGYNLKSYPAQENRRVKFFNIPEELDKPGEYYLNRETGVLYMIPEGELKSDSLVTYTTFNKRIFTVTEAENITFSGLKISGTLSYGIDVQKSKEIVIDDCEITDIGNVAVLMVECYRSGVKNSYIHDIGSWGIKTQYCGDRTNLVSGECFITNCRVIRFGCYKRCGAMAIQVSYDVGTTVSHCEIGDGPYLGIRFEGNDLTFEYNDFYNLCYETSDTGMIYTGRRYDTQGGVIRYNLFRDTKALQGTTGMKTQAVYLDDMSSSTKVFGNVFYKVPAVALMGGGRYNTFENNVMLECEEPLWFDARGTWDGSWQTMHENMVTNLKKMPYTEGIWAEKYPHLVNILEDEAYLPKHNVLRNNVLYQTPEFNLDAEVKQYSTSENNISITSTKGFADYRNGNFALKEDSEIFTKLPEFEAIPFEKIGTYEYTVEDIYVEKTSEASSEEPADDTIKVLLNGEAIDFADVAPKVINDRTMVPLRAIFEALGAEVAWDDATKTVTAKKGDITIKMTIGADSFTKNDEKVALDSPATIVDSRTLVPVRAIAESFGSKVGWIAESKTVTIED